VRDYFSRHRGKLFFLQQLGCAQANSQKPHWLIIFTLQLLETNFFFFFGKKWIFLDFFAEFWEFQKSHRVQNTAVAICLHNEKNSGLPFKIAKKARRGPNSTMGSPSGFFNFSRKNSQNRAKFSRARNFRFSERCATVCHRFVENYFFCSGRRARRLIRKILMWSDFFSLQLFKSFFFPWPKKGAKNGAKTANFSRKKEETIGFPAADFSARALVSRFWSAAYAKDFFSKELEKIIITYYEIENLTPLSARWFLDPVR